MLDGLFTRVPAHARWFFIPESGLAAPDDTREWHDASRALVASAMLEGLSAGGRAYLSYAADPAAHLDTDIVAWAAGRVAETGAHGFALRVAASDTPRITAATEAGLTSVPDELLVVMRTPLPPGGPAPVPAGVTIRLFLPEDEAAWIALYNLAEDSDLTPQRRHAWLDDPWYRPHLDFVAVCDGRLAAYAQCGMFGSGDALADDDGWIRFLGTDPAFRRRGIGRAVLLSALHGLAEEGCPAAHVMTYANNAPARALYRSVGFAAVESMHFYTL